MERLEDTQLIEKLKENKRVGMARLMDQYGNRLKRTAYMMIKDDKLSEDIVQDTFIKFFEAMEEFREESSLYTYLYKILINECRQKMRKNWFKRVIPFDRLLDDSSYGTFEDEHIRGMTIKTCIEKLSSKHRVVILLYYYEGFSLKDMSQILDIKEGTVKSRLKRGRDQLGIYLKEAGFDEESR